MCNTKITLYEINRTLPKLDLKITNPHIVIGYLDANFIKVGVPLEGERNETDTAYITSNPYERMLQRLYLTAYAQPADSFVLQNICSNDFSQPRRRINDYPPTSVYYAVVLEKIANTEGNPTDGIGTLSESF